MATVLIENLTKIYPPTISYPHRVQALGGVNMSVTGNVFVAVLGPSGSGKTTLLNIVAGVETPTSGSVRAVQDGVPARIGYVFQEPRLLPWRTVLNNMLYVQDRKSDRSRREAEFYLTMVGLKEVAHLYPSQAVGRHAAAGRHRPGVPGEPRHPADGRALQPHGRRSPEGRCATTCRGCGCTPARRRCS